MTLILASELTALTLIGVVTGFLARSMPLWSVFSFTNEAIGKGMRVMLRSSVSDHWKEKVLLTCAVRCLKGIAALFACLALICAAALCIILLFYPLLPELMSRLFYPVGLLFTALGTMFYLLTPRILRHV